MFITRDAFKLPISALSLGSGEAWWSATELVLQRIWFLVHFEEIDSADAPTLSSCRTVLLFNFQSIERFILSNKDDRVLLKSVHIVTPGHVNGSACWRMDKLRAVWQSRKPVDEHGIPMDIFETVSGEKYPASFSSLSEEKLAGETLKFEFPH